MNIINSIHSNVCFLGFNDKLLVELVAKWATFYNIKLQFASSVYLTINLEQKMPTWGLNGSSWTCHLWILHSRINPSKKWMKLANCIKVWLPTTHHPQVQLAIWYFNYIFLIAKMIISVSCSCIHGACQVCNVYVYNIIPWVEIHSLSSELESSSLQTPQLS